ncbi:hypothetical protein R1sor_015412 [Riccia sorocarpa]|uniref:Protein argonaute N-terminal domain-containing protein n=1 Tax=Riccia sorocarpa TaxID=122646 RepID=A0ABD3HC57_9MARC
MKSNGFGSKGAKCDLKLNDFKVKFRPREEVYHYSVSIEPATKRPICRKVLMKLYEIYGQQTLMGKKFAYDGEKSLFTVGPLQFSSKDFQVLLDDDPERDSPVNILPDILL